MVAGVRELAAVEREAAAADALRQPELEALELGDSLVDPRARQPADRRDQSRRLGAWWGGSFASSSPISSSVIPSALGEDDERDPPQHRPWIAPMAGSLALAT